MAAVVQSGAREALSCPDSPPQGSPRLQRFSRQESNASAKSPRCEAFLMTGDKILSLDHHVSPSYAKVVRDQLPPSTHIQESPKRPPLADFPSVRRSLRSRLPVSISQPEGVTAQRQTSCPEESPPEVVADASTVFVSSELPTPSAPPPPVPAHAPEQAEHKTSDNSAKTSVMESSMHSSYYKSAFSNPQLSNRATGSSETFVISTHDSPTKHSTVTVHATTCGPSVSTANSPSLRRILGTARSGDCDQFGSFRSVGTSGTGSVLMSREERDALRLASRLFHLDGFTKTDVASRLNETSEFAALVTTKYLDLFNFSGIRIDAALREFLGRVELRGETSQRERLLTFFSSKYHEANPTLYNNVDDVHTLTCALLLLNSDLHGPNIGKRMTVREFVTNICNTGVDIKRDLLKNLYASIKDKEIAHSLIESPGRTSKKSFSSRQMMLEVDPEAQVEYKSGWIMRKTVYDSDGAKTPFGRRGWRMWFGRLRGLVLYLERDEGDKKRSRYETFSNAILLHHAFASPASDYRKRQHIFRLRTANLGEFLFQTSSASEVDDWVTQLNFVAAAFSSRTLPAPTGSQYSFVRVRLPKMASQAPLTEQLKAHETAGDELRRQLTLVQQDAPPLKARGRPVEEFFFRERYLMQEIARYDEYCKLLRSRCYGSGNTSDSTSGVHSKSDMADELDKISYREAMHH